MGWWRSEGRILGDPAVAISGTDIYEWLPGGFFLLHRVEVVIGQQKLQALELIGPYDPATDSFTARAYDNLGNVTVMRARVDEQGVWRFTGGGDVAAAARPAGAELGGAVRSTLTISPDRSGMTARWERSDDGASWQPWMDMTFTRMPDFEVVAQSWAAPSGRKQHRQHPRGLGRRSGLQVVPESDLVPAGFGRKVGDRRWPQRRSDRARQREGATNRGGQRW